MGVLLIILSAIICIFFGIILGVVIGRSSRNRPSLKNDLEIARKELRDYQESANKHLNRTAELISDVYEKCHELQELTLSGSLRLNNDISRQSLLQPATYVHSIAEHDEKIKEESDKISKGILSEVKDKSKENISDELILDRAPKDYAAN
jgi:uncharacterized membrane-anchored protein YhcB (DUF1043 family)